MTSHPAGHNTDGCRSSPGPYQTGTDCLSCLRRLWQLSHWTVLSPGSTRFCKHQSAFPLLQSKWQVLIGWRMQLIFLGHSMLYLDPLWTDWPDQFLIVQGVGGLAAQDVGGTLVQLQGDRACHPVLTLVDAEPCELTLRTEPETCQTYQPTCNHGHQDTESVCTIHANNGTVRQVQSPGFTHDFHFKFPDFSQTLLSLKKLLLSYTHTLNTRDWSLINLVFSFYHVAASPISCPFSFPFLQIMLTVITKFL